MPYYKDISECRLCGNTSLVPILDLGWQYLSGVFPANSLEVIPSGPLKVVKCHGQASCGLVQLKQTYRFTDMYTSGYGYRSALNPSMDEHLKGVAELAVRLVGINLKMDDAIIDIGSNDGTLLKHFYVSASLHLIGIDPLIQSMGDNYPPQSQKIFDFFPLSDDNPTVLPKAKIITSLAMIYDVEEPLKFAQTVADQLAPEGIWVSEQHYLPEMMLTGAYDACCHEHLSYFGLRQLHYMMDRAGLKIIDLQKTATNGGSLLVVAAKKEAGYAEAKNLIELTLKDEDDAGLNGGATAACNFFAHEVETSRADLRHLLNSLKSEGKKVFGYGASTKGNILLQYCGLTPKHIPFIADVNADKHGKVTPGSHIPIIGEAQAEALRPDYYLVLPWHFKDFILKKETEFIKRGGKFIFPLPQVEIV